MATYENAELGVKFSIPEKITVRKQLEYYSATNETGVWFTDAWGGAKVVIESWECEAYPKLLIMDLDKVTDRKITQVILWVGARVTEHMVKLEMPSPKLSGTPSGPPSDSPEPLSPQT